MEQELIANARTFFRSAELVYRSGDYTSASTLYFKTLFVSLDLLVFRKTKKIPKDHTERFRILEKECRDEYLLLDKYFPVYRSTYSSRVEKHTCEEVRDYAKKVVASLGI